MFTFGDVGGNGGMVCTEGAFSRIMDDLLYYTCNTHSSAVYCLRMQRRDWKIYKGVAARRIPETVRSSINPNGEITFDLDTFRKMGEPEAMCLMYDESRRIIGLKPAHPDEPHAVLVRVRHERSNRVVRSMPFLRENGIHLDRTLRFPYSFLENNVLILDLRTAVTCGKGYWKKIKR